MIISHSYVGLPEGTSIYDCLILGGFQGLQAATRQLGILSPDVGSPRQGYLLGETCASQCFYSWLAGLVPWSRREEHPENPETFSMKILRIIRWSQLMKWESRSWPTSIMEWKKERRLNTAEMFWKLSEKTNDPERSWCLFGEYINRQPKTLRRCLKILQPLKMLAFNFSDSYGQLFIYRLYRWFAW